MSKRLYRVMVFGGILTWLLVGMYLTRVLTPLDVGTPPQRLDLILLAIWLISGIVDAIALIRVPIRSDAERSSVPAAA